MNSVIHHFPKSKTLLLATETGAVVPHLSTKGSKSPLLPLFAYYTESAFPTEASGEIPMGSIHPFNNAFHCSEKLEDAPIRFMCLGSRTNKTSNQL